MRGRAVSDTLGFVLIFGLMITSVGIISTAGFGTLEDRRDAAQFQNVRVGFDVFAHNVEDIAFRGVASRGTELDLGGGQVTSGSPVVVNVTVGNVSYVTTTRPVVYQRGDERLVYSLTAVFRESDDGANAALVRDPRFGLPAEVAPNQTALVVVTTGEFGTVGSNDPVLIRTATADRNVRRVANNRTVTVRVNTTAARAPGWARYFRSELGAGVCTYPGSDPSTVACTFDSSRISLTQLRLAVTVEG